MSISPESNNADDPRKVWNENPALRVAVPLLTLSFVWSLLVPEIQSSWLVVPDFIMFGLGMCGLIVLGAWFIESDTEKAAESGVFPSYQVESASWPGTSDRGNIPPMLSGYQPPQKTDLSVKTTGQKLLLGVIWMVVMLGIVGKAIGIFPVEKYIGSFVNIGRIEVIGVLLGIVIIHEMIHAVGAIAAGCSVSIGARIPYSAYCRITGGMLGREQRIVISLLPNIVLTSAGVGLIVFGSSLGNTIGVLALVSTIAGGGMDFHNAVNMAREAPGKRWYIPPDQGGSTMVYRRNGEAKTALWSRIERRVLKATDLLKVSSSSYDSEAGA